jgi:uncharacterized Zn finger protein
MAWPTYRGFEDRLFPRYVSVRERSARIALEVTRLMKQGRKLEPLQLESKKIATSFWGKAWCRNLETYGDFANRLPRGRSYLRDGSVIDLRIGEGRVDALVAGSEVYEVSVELDALPRRRWTGLVAQCKGQIDSVVALLRGELPEPLITAMVDRRTGLFPARKQMRFRCSCPDYAVLCKHIAAVLYGVGARFDQQPETFFILRSVKLEQLVAKSAAGVALRRPAARKEAAAIEKLFGIELDRSPRRRRKTAY